jgi:hypothetical protein
MFVTVVGAATPAMIEAEFQTPATTSRRGTGTQFQVDNSQDALGSRRFYTFNGDRQSW